MVGVQDHASWISVLFFSLVFTYILSLLLRRRNKSNLPPGPPKLPIIGNLHQLGKLPHQTLRDLAQRYGPLMTVQFGWFPTLVVSSAKMAELIKKTNDLDFAARPHLAAPRKVLYDGRDVIFSPYGEYWRQAKKICVLELLSQKRVQSFGYVREEEVGKMLQSISDSCKAKGFVNMREAAISLSGDVACRVALGKKYVGFRFSELVNESQKALSAFNVGDIFPGLGWIDLLTGVVQKATKNAQAWDRFFDTVIQDHLEQGADENEQPKDFVDVMLRLKKNSHFDIPLTMNHIKALIMDMVAAGTDPISTTLEWAMAELVKHPKVMKEAQEEIRRVAGKKAKVEESDVYQMEYLKLTIKETLRLHPPGPLLIPQEAIRDVEIQGYAIPAKTRVYINAWAIGRDPASWERAEEFLPERFINSSVDFKGQHFQLIPFGAGRRSCPGMSFAVPLIELALANLLHQFDWKLPNGESEEDLDLSETSGATVSRKQELLLFATPHFV